MTKCSKFFLAMIFGLSVTVSYADQNDKSSLTSNPSLEFNKIYECSSRIFGLTLSYAPPIDVRVLNKDLFFIFDGYKNELYIYSPYFAGKASLDLDKDGRKIQIMKDWPGYQGTHYTAPQYNVRIPYFSKDTSKQSGYYYLTINELTPFQGHKDARINLPPRFLPGEAQLKPDFSRMEPTKNGVTLLSAGGENMFAASQIEFHPLDIEDKIWGEKATNNFDGNSMNILISQINEGIKGLDRSIQEMGVGMGMGHWDPQSMANQMKENINSKNDAINVCRDIAKELSLTTIQETIEAQNDASQAKAECSDYKAGTNDFKIAGQDYNSSFSIDEISGHIDCQEVHSVLSQYLGTFNACHVPENLPGVGWAAFRAQFEINPDGQINQDSFNAYALNTTAMGYTSCLYPPLRGLKFKQMNEKPVKLQVTFSVGRK